MVASREFFSKSSFCWRVICALASSFISLSRCVSCSQINLPMHSSSNVGKSVSDRHGTYRKFSERQKSASVGLGFIQGDLCTSTALDRRFINPSPSNRFQISPDTAFSLTKPSRANSSTKVARDIVSNNGVVG
ncbi:hypothetical protein PF008_g3860 [Phytophthora fragariae]|uniref:Secreted protein n=1 Tax=Phytophthora fragariae TaxID=53985 RepID=A0A6G0SDK1_9STRA|nr:hypothetical protein PF008_g3860 [Phytophthora fragariae]